jgi:uncharacterized protein (DUF1697 family)
MPHYVALLRGINVGGRTVKMDRLRAVLGGLGFSDVETLIASGNVLFRSPSRSEPALERKIEAALEQAFGFRVTTMVRSAADMQKVATLEPFGSADGEAKVHIAFLQGEPLTDGVKKVLALRGDGEDIRLHGRELYFKIAGKMMDSAMFRAPIEKLLGVPITIRNANTVRKLAAKTAE